MGDRVKKRVIVTHPQVPFVTGGAEMLSHTLVEQINLRLDGVEADLVQIPWTWEPPFEILANCATWRMLQVEEVDGMKVDLLIGTKFPSYAARHENKVLWLVHQHRIFYELQGSCYDKPELSLEEEVVRDRVRAIDKDYLRECHSRFTIAHTVSERLKKFNNLDSTPLFPPPRLRDRIRPGEFGEEVLYIGRLNEWKRPDLLISALASCKQAKACFLGTGSSAYVEKLEKMVQELDLADRCHLAGFVSDTELLERLAKARAIFYAPVSEDYGFATIEAFLAKKPVITCKDSGEVERFVGQTGSGFVLDPQAAAIAKALDKVYSLSAAELEGMALSGFELAHTISWAKVLERLVVPHL